jgi:HNH endonuclease
VDTTEFLMQFQDHVAPRLDTNEQVIYSRLVGRPDVVIGFKSARRAMALGIGKAGTPMSEHVCYERLRSLEKKGYVQLLGTEEGGTRLRALLPSEVPGLLPAEQSALSRSLEALDFFEVAANRVLILQRECGRCFYCLRSIDENTHVIEHAVSRPSGNNTSRNVVAACRQCDNRKGSAPAEDFLRTLYREKLLSAEDFEGRISHLERLLAGKLKPNAVNTSVKRHSS